MSHKRPISFVMGVYYKLARLLIMSDPQSRVRTEFITKLIRSCVSPLQTPSADWSSYQFSSRF